MDPDKFNAKWIYPENINMSLSEYNDWLVNELSNLTKDIGVDVTDNYEKES